MEEQYAHALPKAIHTEELIRPAKPRAEIILRCSVEEADRICAAAARRQTSISKFVVCSLRRHWKAKAASQLYGPA